MKLQQPAPSAQLQQPILNKQNQFDEQSQLEEQKHLNQQPEFDYADLILEYLHKLDVEYVFGVPGVVPSSIRQWDL